jgi:hypothetical protein
MKCEPNVIHIHIIMKKYWQPLFMMISDVFDILLP